MLPGASDAANAYSVNAVGAASAKHHDIDLAAAAAKKGKLRFAIKGVNSEDDGPNEGNEGKGHESGESKEGNDGDESHN